MTKTNKYISTLDNNRQGHHNYVIERTMLELATSYDSLNKQQQENFDDYCCQKLKILDIPEDERLPNDEVDFNNNFEFQFTFKK